LEKVPDTAMVVLTDAGDAGNIHPADKLTVGARLALGARVVAYHEKVEYSGPMFQSMKIRGDKASLRFTHVGGGLVAKGGPLKGFTIAGEDKRFFPARAEIEGDTIIVTSDQVAAPVAVRYGWSNVPDVNLYNQAGLPASPFRTDVD
jgi:sialate O-acetylesterase